MGSGEIPALGSLLDGRYELLGELGQGGCAVVFEAHDHRLGRRVAIKFPLGVAGDAVKTARFDREARVLSSIHHPNVCAVVDSGMTPRGTPFLVMERLFGESVRGALARRQRFSVPEVVAIGLQLLSALDAVHGAGIIHRDVKPDNIILVGRGGCDPLVKLLDFGLCRRAFRGSAPEVTMTAEGAIVGTPEYMAPEQVLGSKPDVRVDVYAVGVVLYEMLSGERTFFATSVRDILSGVMHKKIRPLGDVRSDAPRSLEAVIAKAMARDPAHRHQTAGELIAALAGVREELAALARAVARRSAPTLSDWEAPTTPFIRRPARREAPRLPPATPPPRPPHH